MLVIQIIERFIFDDDEDTNNLLFLLSVIVVRCRFVIT